MANTAADPCQTVVRDNKESYHRDHLIRNFSDMLKRIDKGGFTKVSGMYVMTWYGEAVRNRYCEFSQDDIAKRRELVAKLTNYDLANSIPALAQTTTIDWDALQATWVLSGALYLHEHYSDLAEELVNSQQFLALQKQFDTMRFNKAKFADYSVYSRFQRSYARRPSHMHCDLWKGVTHIGGIGIGTLRRQEKTTRRSYHKENERMAPMTEEDRLWTMKEALDRLELIGFDEKSIESSLRSYGRWRSEEPMVDAQLDRLRPFMEQFIPFFDRIIPRLEGTVINGDALKAMTLLSGVRYLAEDFPDLANALVTSEAVMALEQYFESLRDNGFTIIDFTTYYLCKRDSKRYPSSHFWHGFWENIVEINGDDIETSLKKHIERQEKRYFGDRAQYKMRPRPADADPLVLFTNRYESDDSDNPDNIEELKDWDTVQDAADNDLA